MDYIPNTNFHSEFKKMYKDPVKMLADVVEAVIGAVFLDCIGDEEKGIKEAERVWNYLVLDYIKQA